MRDPAIIDMPGQVRGLAAAGPDGPPQIAFASADINACAKVLTIACNTSGDAPSICSRSRSTGFTLSDAAIAFLSFNDLAVSKDHAVAVSYLRNTPIMGKSYTTPVDATSAASGSDRARCEVQTASWRASRPGSAGTVAVLRCCTSHPPVALLSRPPRGGELRDRGWCARVAGNLGENVPSDGPVRDLGRCGALGLGRFRNDLFGHPIQLSPVTPDRFRLLIKIPLPKARPRDEIRTDRQ